MQIIATLPKNKQEYLTLHFESKKLRDYEGEDFKNLDIFLIALCKFIGITDVPQLQHRKLIMSFLAENFGDFGKEEIERAMNLALCFKLEVQDLKHYNKLTPQWIASILNAYKVHRGKEINTYRALLEDKAYNEKPKPTKKQLNDSILENITIALAHYIKDEQIIDYGNVFYFFLEGKKIINLTLDEKQKKYEQAIDNLVREKAKQKTTLLLHPTDVGKIRIAEIVKDVIKIKEGGDGAKGSIQREARRISLAEFFDKIISEKLDIKDFIARFEDEL